MEPVHFKDAQDGEWLRNLDGTYRCLNAEIRSVSLTDIITEFGASSKEA